MLDQARMFLVLIMLALGLLLGAAQCGAVSQSQPGAGAAGSASQPEFEGHAEDEELSHSEESAAGAHLAPVALGVGEKLRVLATTGIVADIVANVGGDKIDLAQLLPVGADPHTFQPSPQDLARVADTHLIFANGMGLETFLDEMIANAGGEAAVVHVSEGIELRELAAEEAHPDEAEADHEHEGGDPHTWTTPANAIIFVGNIEQALSALDPENAATYAANAAAYERQLQELDRWVTEQIGLIPPENRQLVTDHATFGYYADRYGLTQAGAVIPSFSTSAEPSAQELAALEDRIKEYGVKAVFVGTSVNPALSKQVAEDTGVALVTLYTGSLGPAGSGVETYIDYIRYNTHAIVTALKAED